MPVRRLRPAVDLNQQGQVTTMATRLGYRMKISQSERETLTGPAVIGVIVGLVCAACLLAFNSEYGSATESGWSTAWEGIQVFFAGFLFAFVPLGAAPVLIARLARSMSNR